MFIREAKQEDCGEIFDWWNDPLTRKMMYDTADVEWDAHQKWFNKITADENILLCLGYDDHGKVGVVRFDRKSELSFEVGIDEATNALDSAKEDEVMEALENLPGHVTVIMVAHRLATLKNCSKIIDLSGADSLRE